MIKFLNRHIDAKVIELERDELRARQDKLRAETLRLYERITEWHEHSTKLCSLVLELHHENDDLLKRLETAEMAEAQLLFEIEQLKKERTQAPESVK
jgi:hypothetical protein